MDLITFFGRLHPLVVHLPIGMLLLAACFLLLGKHKDFTFLHKALPTTFLLSSIGAIGAALLGWLLARNGGYAEDTLFWHRWLGIAVAVVSLAAWYWTKQRKQLNIWLMGGLIALLSYTGHLGGSLTHGEDYLIQPLRGAKASEVLQLPQEKDSIEVYQHLVKPVLQAKCYACHNDSKQNGGLNLASWEGLQKGGDSGDLLAQNVWESELFKRVTLSQSNQKFMPPKGDPYTFNEIQILKFWLAEGAKQDLKLTEVEVSNEVKEVLLHEYALDLSPKTFVETIEIEALDETIIQELEQVGWRVKPLGESSNFLEISPQQGVDIDPAKLEVLLKAAAHITWLNLGRSELKNQDMEILANFSNLSRLRLEKNNLSDEGLAHLTGLEHLESLNLYGNPITDAGLKYLENLPALKKVYLWQTQVSEDGKSALSTKRSQVEII